ncbi:hypothetical protein CDD83_3959 [Cordyceps sp. RAO-2017]|nr:hypothetical protein CDD83_3959 [Cordyceps sp. RAO-2017]
MAHPARQDSPEALRQPALSSFLQEKLQRERRAESEKLAYSTSLSRTDMTASVDIGHSAQTSPFKVPDAVGCRPRSSAGTDNLKKKGLGVKEMEQVVSSLHKQNFDLKLELFHRRERQTTLEERIEALEADREKSHIVADRLVEELEKRDKAVEEAVAMIVLLEAKVDQLIRERSMVQQMDSETFFGPHDLAPRLKDATPRASAPGRARPEGDDGNDVRTVNRMPSFLSERDDNTETLRSVYLGVRGNSSLSLPRLVEGSSETEANSNGQGLASPTLSVLSESSFVSVYGPKGGADDSVPSSPPAHVDEPLALDGLDVGFTAAASQDEARAPRRRAASVGRMMGIGRPPPRSSTAVPFQSITGVIGHESPLQRLMRLDNIFTSGKDAPGQHQGGEAERSSAKKSPPRNSKLTKEEKRSALRRVLTDGPGGARLQDQGLPPTPDTISTSTLHRFKNSNETLSQEQELNGALLHESAGSVHDGKSPAEMAASGAPLAPRQFSGPRRPHSTRQPGLFGTTGNDWDSDSDDDDDDGGGSDARSLESSLDIWLRESTKPDKNGGHVSPDLFSFPTNVAAGDGSWAVDAMYSGGTAGGASISPSHSHVQGLLSLRHQLFPWSHGPPPPNRRSSLHATTGSASDAAPAGAGGSSPCAHDAGSKAAGNRSRPGRKANEDQQSKRAELRTPVQQQQQAPPPQPSSDPKRYPPISGQQGARAGLNRLLRRSLGSNGAQSAAHAPLEDGPPGAAGSETAVAPTAAADTPKTYHPMGVPSWVLRNGPIEDVDRSGATPPPIAPHPRQQGRKAAGEGADTDTAPPDAAAPPPTEPVPAPDPPPDAADAAGPKTAQEGAAGGSGTGTRRKWLTPFGLKNRNG